MAAKSAHCRRAKGTRDVMATRSDETMFASYVELSQALQEDVVGVCLLNGRSQSHNLWGQIDLPGLVSWVHSLGWTGKQPDRVAAAITTDDSTWLVAMPLQQPNGALLGVFCVRLSSKSLPDSGEPAHRVSQQLTPVLHSLHRELMEMRPVHARLQSLTERTAELEWLFKVTSGLHSSHTDHSVIEELLHAATDRLSSGFGVLHIPGKRLSLEYCRVPEQGDLLRQAWKQARPHLLDWAHKHQRPIVLNSAGHASINMVRCKILSVPAALEENAVMGVLAFFNTQEASDYDSRRSFLARHLGRQMATLVNEQFDLMTGLYTRDGLEQMYRKLQAELWQTERSVIYLDLDHMQMVNELHGFEVGNELIVCIAELLGPPLIPQGALAARLSGDRFAVVLPESSTDEAATMATALQQSAARLVIGPAQSTIDVSISCGIAALVDMPQGLPRALAAAEIACKAAKSRGRARVEFYSCEDKSMVRPQGDALAIGQLRAALRNDQVMLYAQRITPLQDPDLPGGYEILMRLRNPDNTALLSTGELIEAAQRYQLLPTVDRWIVRHSLQMLMPYRSMLKSRGISVSINISGQSLGDEAFVRQITQDFVDAKLPHGSVCLEITEQAAVKNLRLTNELIQPLRLLGCRLALDDFGTGANSLSLLKGLQISRLKIDGSFIRDIDTNKRSLAAARGVIEMAKELGLDTVAEYVETDTIARIVKELGANYAQGYAYGHPEPLVDVLRALANDEESQRLHKPFMEL